MDNQNQDALYDSTYVPARAKHFPYFEAALKKVRDDSYLSSAKL